MLRVSWAEDCFSAAEAAQLCALLHATVEAALASPAAPLASLADELLGSARGPSPDIDLDI
ncbi:MAG: hypothetical protein KC636_18430 [Myxococcales bacterium]|nr:hypothetical protein [Myxococcales bacterium]